REPLKPAQGGVHLLDDDAKRRASAHGSYDGGRTRDRLQSRIHPVEGLWAAAPIPRLCGGRRCTTRLLAMRFDAQGFGRSPAATEPATRADDLYELLRTLNVSRAHLVGISAGGARPPS